MVALSLDARLRHRLRCEAAVTLPSGKSLHQLVSRSSHANVYLSLDGRLISRRFALIDSLLLTSSRESFLANQPTTTTTTTTTTKCFSVGLRPTDLHVAMSVRHSLGQSGGSSVIWSVGRSVSRFVGRWSVGRLVSRSVCRSLGQSNRWSDVSSVAWSVVW